MKISVILTAYNAATYLREALDSIVAAGAELERRVGGGRWTVEVICVDDGSTDESGAMLDKYREKVEKVGGGGEWKVIHQANKGLSAARNVGLAMATGDYITFCDADDMLSPYWFSNAAALIEETRPDLLRARLVFGKEPPVDFLSKRIPRLQQEVVGQRDCLKWAWDLFSFGGFSVLNFIKSELKPFMRFPEGGLLKEDSLMLLGLAPRLGKIVQSDYCGYFYRNTQGSLLRRKRIAQKTVLDLKSLAEVWAQQRNLASEAGLLNDLRSMIRRFADNDVIDWAIDSADEPREAKRQVRQAWMALRDAGAFDGRYHNRAMFYLPFKWWKMTGNESLIKQTWKLFLFVRKMLLRK